MSLNAINNFLSQVDLAGYRKKYSHIKLVELDLDKDIQAIRHLYRGYWEQRDNFPSFEEFYERYSHDLRKELETFRYAKMFSKKTFRLGLPARIYRTWASLLTQIQGGYAAEEIYKQGKVEMSADLDYKGIDIRLHSDNGIINVQIKKESMSREIRAPWQRIRNKETIIVVTYEIPGCDPLTPKTKQPCVPFKRWQGKWARKLSRLDNGFIIFEPKMFTRKELIVP